MTRLLHAVGTMYEAAHCADRWPDALQALGCMVGASAGVMVMRSRGDGGIVPIAEFGARAIPVATIDMVFDAAPCRRSLRWRLCHGGNGSTASSAYCRLPGEAGAPEIVVVLEVPEQTVLPLGGIRHLDRLVPHLRRALALRWQGVQLRRAVLCNALAARYGCCAMAIADVDGHVHAATEMAQKRLQRAGANGATLPTELKKLAATATAGDEATAMPWFTPAGEQWAIARPVALDDAIECAFAAPVVALALAGGVRPLPEPAILRRLFRLTEAEVGLVRALAGGAAPDDIARRAGLSVHTIRTQLKSVLKKCGVKRQAELVALIARLPAEGREHSGRIPHLGVSQCLAEGGSCAVTECNHDGLLTDECGIAGVGIALA